ncbi:hypothetical protein OS493_011724 [Desmophyllum pertusum]|uniref:C2 domain-containing protein n=1 Tax=Desmophyllum pertusum TaxID=174260 RepID=A0A9W9YDQ9_9CNID|nr:hypothetical protein OS493_011724 [Desmophyllum pertusum]
MRERGKRKQGKSVWSPSTSRNWPHYSDVAGNLNLPKNSFTEPEGWVFSGDWIEPRRNLTMIQQPEGNLTEFLDEVYEHEARKFPGWDWEPDKPRYVNSYGEETTLSTDPPTGWIKMADWSVDLNRAVDDEGWEYSRHRSYCEYDPEEKAYYLNRRRRLIRQRRRGIEGPGKQVHEDPLSSEGWEYARSFHESFHPDERSTDCLRRRRLLHKIVPSPEKKTRSGMKFPVFKVLVKGLKGKQSALCVLPRMLVSHRPTKYQLWVSIYQARGLIAQDDTGMNDPYVRVTFSNQSQVTETITQTLCPTWDQTLIFKDVEIFYNQRDLVQNPPSVVMEIFDYDKRVHDFLGRCIFKPKVRLEGNERPPEPKLVWHKVHRGDQDGGQILTECELFLTAGAKLPDLPKPRDRVFPVRPGVTPDKKPKAIEILSWGVRDIKNNKPLLVSNLSVEFECNRTILRSNEVITDLKRCPNFSCPILERTILELPTNDEYAPPINIRVFNNTMFGKPALVGLHEIRSLKNFEVQPQLVNSQSHAGVVVPADGDKKGATERKRQGRANNEQETLDFKTQEVFDWWSKYDASRAEEAKTTEEKEKALSTADKKKLEYSMTHIEKYLDKGYDILKIYPCKLEDVPQFRGFNDFVITFPLRKGKTKSTKEGKTEVGQFKGAFRIFNDPDCHDNTMATMHLRPKKPIDCVVRVYVIRATQLQPKDSDGLADPYLIVSLGDTKHNRKGERRPKTLNPIFGSMFEFKAKIPLAKDLKIKVMDYDYPDLDDLIGETVIDLEQRLLSSYHATCGLPKTYFTSGPFQWRDTLTPFQLLAKHCTLTGKELWLDTGKPEIINIGETPYSLSNFESEALSNQDEEDPLALQRLALHVLHTCGLVPEHVEARPLFDKVRPNIEQGKLEMWVDIFSEEDVEFANYKYDAPGADQTDGRQLFTIVKQPSHSTEERQDPGRVEKYSRGEELLLKSPVIIDPRQPLKYELRVVIWNTTEVLLEEKSVMGEKMSDIFVKAWIAGIDKEQATSVHERSLDGNGSFNWRMVFPFEYLLIDKKIVVKEKVHRLSRDLRQENKSPLLKVQIWDKDRFSSSDFIGDLELDLSKLVRPCVHPKYCGTRKDPREHNQFVDIFIQQKITGWWACYDKSDITGKVEMTLEILNEEEAEATPVGLGQSEPNQHPTLEKPIRPPHSFLWYLAPLKTFRYIMWKNYKGFFIKGLVFFLLFLVIALFVYSVPSYTAKKLLGA